MTTLLWRFPIALVVASFCSAQAQEYPSAKISNGLVSAEFYLPDPVKGSYRATRFDWSGIIHELKYAGHNYFGQWYDKHDPLIHDAITGPVNIFDNAGPATGYAEAKPGETFVRIGVGRVLKPEEAGYRELQTYQVADPGKWRVETKAASIKFVQDLQNDAAHTGYGYLYTKDIALTQGKPEMVLRQELKNTGTKPIDTNVFNHGFFQIDKEPTGPSLVWTFPFEPHTTGNLSGMAAIQGHQVVYLRELQPGERVQALLTGYEPTAETHRFTLENKKTGAGVRVAGDRPMSKLTFWSRRGAYSPEATVHLHIEPGETAKWRTTYEFYTRAEPGQ